MDKLSLDYSVSPGGQAVGIRKYMDQIGWGPFVQGDQIFWDHLSMGTEFDGDRLSSVQGDQFYGNCLFRGQEVEEWTFRDQIGSGPNASQPSIQYTCSCVALRSCTKWAPWLEIT